MTLKEQVMTDIKTAMKAKDQNTLSVLRLLNSAFKNKEIEVRPNDLTEDDTLAVLKKAVKQRKESIDQFTKADRKDLADKESAELEVLNRYMPEEMSSEKISAIVQEVIKEQSADSIKQMGAVMKEVIVRCQGAADNKVVSQMIKAALN